MEHRSLRNAVFFSVLLIASLCFGLHFAPANITTESAHTTETSDNTKHCVETEEHGEKVCDEEEKHKETVKN